MKSISELMAAIKARPDYPGVGMILAHNGVVRETTRDGRRVTGLRVAVDHDRLATVLTEQRARPGITDVQIEINEGKDLSVGDDVMYLVVAGDIRENVIGCLADTIDQVKATVTQKTQFFAD
jgi:molybdopterin synthase catalytic subunit